MEQKQRGTIFHTDLSEMRGKTLFSHACWKPVLRGKAKRRDTQQSTLCFLKQAIFEKKLNSREPEHLSLDF